jgi:YD repeat-containing protein
MRKNAWIERADSPVALSPTGLELLAASRPRRMVQRPLLLALFALVGSFTTGEVRAQTVAAGSFEVPEAGTSVLPNPTVTDAVFTGNAGIAGNASPYGFTAPEGNQVGYIQSTGASSSIALTARNLVAGTSYRVRVLVAKRYSFGANQITVAFNGTTLGSYSPATEGFVQYLSNTFTASADTGQITLTGGTVPNTSSGVDSVWIVPATGIETIAYQYDARGRLVGVARTGTVNDNVSTSYAYDKADNRTNVTVTGSTSTPPP